MKKRFNEYLNKDHSFDKETMLGVFCLVIVITGIFGLVMRIGIGPNSWILLTNTGTG